MLSLTLSGGTTCVVVGELVDGGATMTDEERPSLAILVYDRELEDKAWLIRRQWGELLGPGLGKWLASPERGRFLVVTLPAEGMEEIFQSVADEQAVIDLVAGARVNQLIESRKARVAADFNLHPGVAPPLEAKLRQLIREIEELAAPRVEK